MNLKSSATTFKNFYIDRLLEIRISFHTINISLAFLKGIFRNKRYFKKHLTVGVEHFSYRLESSSLNQ